MPHFRVTAVLAATAAVAMMTLPSIARAEDSNANWWAFGVLVIVVPTIWALVIACLLIWLLCPLYLRPVALAVCAVPCTPLHTGTGNWPLWSYLLGNRFSETVSEIIWRTSLVALLAFALGWFAIWLKLRASPPNKSLERTHER